MAIVFVPLGNQLLYAQAWWWENVYSWGSQGRVASFLLAPLLSPRLFLDLAFVPLFCLSSVFSFCTCAVAFLPSFYPISLSSLFLYLLLSHLLLPICPVQTIFGLVCVSSFFSVILDLEESLWLSVL